MLRIQKDNLHLVEANLRMALDFSTAKNSYRLSISIGWES